MNKAVAAAVLGSVLFLGGCAATQKLSVMTSPPGAHVTLVRYGITKTEGGVPGMSIGAAGERFEDPPIPLGTSPVEYEFRLEETAEEVSIVGIFMNVRREFTEGLVRAEKDGRVAERRVTFTGEPVIMDLPLPAQ